MTQTPTYTVQLEEYALNNNPSPTRSKSIFLLCYSAALSMVLKSLQGAEKNLTGVAASSPLSTTFQWERTRLHGVNEK